MSNKPVPLGPPLPATEAELAALDLPPDESAIQAALLDWVQLAPARARGYVYARVDNPVDVTPNA